MKKILLYGKSSENLLQFLKGRKSLKIVRHAPDIVITYGGDGALLGAEREYPGIPKVPIRDSIRWPRCGEHENYRKIFDMVESGAMREFKLPKLAGTFRDFRLLGINDVFIHNLVPVSAIRYKVKINGENYGDEIVGDGVGVSTPHGSTAYYRSITHSTFRTGIGLAFSNSTEVTNHLVLPNDSIVEVLITRGPAILVADNSPESSELKIGDKVIISKAEETAVICGLDIFMCQRCRKLRHPTCSGSQTH